jgi:hypothetical protein
MNECAHILATGRKCRRIAPGDKRFCPAHLVKRNRDRDTLERQRVDYGHSLADMDLSALLSELSDALADLLPRMPGTSRASVVRAAIAASVTLEYLEEQKAPNLESIPQPGKPSTETFGLPPELASRLSPEPLSAPELQKMLLSLLK